MFSPELKLRRVKYPTFPYPYTLSDKSALNEERKDLFKFYKTLQEMWANFFR